MEEKMTKKLLSTNDQILTQTKERTAELIEANTEMKTGWIPPQLTLSGDEAHKSIQSVDFLPMMMATVDKLAVMSHKAEPVDFIDLLDDVARVFDHLCETIGVLKVDLTATNYFMAVSDFTACLK